MIIPFSKPSIDSKDTDAVSKAVASLWYTYGPFTKKFEKKFASYVGAKYAVMTNSCTSALKISYKYAKEELGCKNFTYPKNTYCATYSAGIEIGLKPIADKLNDPSVEVGTIMHYGGVKAARVNHKFVIEDSAHRIEKNDPLIGDVRCYSFHATKNMTTGTGGMLVTNKKNIYEKARLYCEDGIDRLPNGNRSRDYKVSAFCGGYEGNEIMAAFGLAQLAKLPQFTSRRNQIVAKYNKAFGQKWTGNHIYPYFVAGMNEIKNLAAYLEKKGISTSYHFPGSGWLGLSLPIYPKLTDKEIDYIIESVLAWQTKSEQSQKLR